MNLRSMTATVDFYPTIDLQLEDGRYVTLTKALVLKSYDSRVAVYSNGRVYLLPRYDYSVTTWKHVHAFIQDYCDGIQDVCANDMRRYVSDGLVNSGIPYCMASGIYYGGRIYEY